MRVFLLGGTGWIGGAIADALLATGHTPVALVRAEGAPAAALRQRGAEVVIGDLADLDLLGATARRAEATVHAAAAPAAVSDAALRATTTALAGSGAPLVFISGSSVYGDTGPAGPADEDAPPRATHPVSALDHERAVLVDALAAGVRGTVVRGAGILYGRGGGSTPTFWREDARQAGAARYVGNGRQRWSAVHVEDLADLVVRVIQRPPTGEVTASVFNAAAEAIPLREAAETVAEVIGAPGGARSISEAEAAAAWDPFWASLLARNLWLSSARAERELNWQPRAAGFLADLRAGSYQRRV